MTPGMDELIPDAAVTLGADDTATDTDTAQGDQGTHRDVTVTLTILGDESATFTSRVTVENQPWGDAVEIESVPSHLGVEMLGCHVDLGAEVLASGRYSWQDSGQRRTDRTRTVNLLQIVPCPTCGQTLDGKGGMTAFGRVCSKCQWEIENGGQLGVEL
jgi:hypothetical protein